MSNIKKESIHLYIIQIANYIVPLITLPYLTKTLTLSGMGKLGLAQALLAIIQAFIDFGFTYTASRNVSLNLEKKDEVRIIYTNVQFIRFLIFLVILIFSTIILFILNVSSEDRILYLLAIVSSFSAVLMPMWIFNGISKNSVISRYLIIFKFITLIFIFGFIKNPNDYLYAFVILNSSMVFLGIPIYFFLKKNDIYYNFKDIEFSLIKNYLAKGFNVFIGTFFSMSYTNFIPFFIKYFTSDYWVGVYVVVERLMFVLRQMYMPIIQASYARLCICIEGNLYSEYYNIIKKIIIIFIAISLAALIGNFFAGKLVIYYLLNNEVVAYKYTFYSMVLCFVVAVSMLLTYCYYLAKDLGHILKWIYVFAALFFLVEIYFIVKYEKVSLENIYLTIIFVEVFIVLTQLVLLKIVSKNEKKQVNI